VFVPHPTMMDQNQTEWPLLLIVIGPFRGTGRLKVPAPRLRVLAAFAPSVLS
jgi:hypothetical protein